MWILCVMKLKHVWDKLHCWNNERSMLVHLLRFNGIFDVCRRTEFHYCTVLERTTAGSSYCVSFHCMTTMWVSHSDHIHQAHSRPHLHCFSLYLPHILHLRSHSQFCSSQAHHCSSLDQSSLRQFRAFVVQRQRKSIDRGLVKTLPTDSMELLCRQVGEGVVL